MNNSVLLLPSAIILVPIFSAVVFSLVIFRRNRRGRRSPLTGNLLRGPGETLREGIEQVSEKMDNAIFIVFGTCLPPMSFVILLSHLQYNKVPVWQLVVTYLFFILLVFWANL